MPLPHREIVVDPLLQKYGSEFLRDAPTQSSGIPVEFSIAMIALLLGGVFLLTRIPSGYVRSIKERVTNGDRHIRKGAGAVLLLLLGAFFGVVLGYAIGAVSRGGMMPLGYWLLHYPSWWLPWALAGALVPLVGLVAYRLLRN